MRAPGTRPAVTCHDCNQLFKSSWSKFGSVIALSDATASAQSDIQLFYSPAKDLGKTGVSKNRWRLDQQYPTLRRFWKYSSILNWVVKPLGRLFSAWMTCERRTTDISEYVKWCSGPNHRFKNQQASRLRKSPSNKNKPRTVQTLK